MFADIIERFSHLRVLCIGDIMLDRFIYGNIDRISPEAPVPIFQYKYEQDMLGGAGNVANNLSTLGCKTTFLGFVGQDRAGDEIGHLLKKSGVHSHLIHVSDIPTILKTRLVAGHNHVLRIDQEKKLPLVKDILPRYYRLLAHAIKKTDIVLLSDYNKGIFSHESTQMIIQLCNEYEKKVIIDPKINDYSKYANSYLVKPNLKEFALAIDKPLDFKSPTFMEDVIDGAKKIFTEFNIKNLVITLSENGMLAIQSNDPDHVYHVNTRVKEVFDVSGAGDTVMSIIGASIGADASIVQAMELSNIGASIVVEKLGTATVSAQELLAESSHGLSTAPAECGKIFSLEKAEIAIKEAKNAGKKIGFTNGCFDLLHMGHLHSLKEAKKCCDYLVVGVNSDASVKKNKGESRPVQDEITRSHLLASLECVDCVVIFGDTTAIPLVEALRPDVIAKEGYALKDWPEAQFVISYGGEACTLDRLEGYSTTNLIQRINQ